MLLLEIAGNNSRKVSFGVTINSWPLISTGKPSQCPQCTLYPQLLREFTIFFFPCSLSASQYPSRSKDDLVFSKVQKDIKIWELVNISTLTINAVLVSSRMNPFSPVMIPKQNKTRKAKKHHPGNATLYHYFPLPKYYFVAGKLLEIFLNVSASFTSHLLPSLWKYSS